MVVPTISLFLREPAVTIDLIMNTGRIFNPSPNYFILKNSTAKTIVYPNEAKEQAKIYLRKGQDFIWNATNITTLMRQQLIDLFVSYQAYTKLVYIEKPHRQWRLQNRNRAYPLPDIVLDKMVHNLDVPQLTEAHEVLYWVE